MKLFCFADWQVSTDDIGRVNKFDECDRSIFRIKEAFIASGATIAVFTGDLFEVYNPSEASRQLATKLIRTLSELADHVVITAGNHDLQRRGNNVFDDGFNRKPKEDAIKTIVESIGADNIHYYEWTGFYKLNDQVSFAVWSHKDYVYGNNENPWESGQPEPDTEFVFDLFHETVRGASDINGLKMNGKYSVDGFLGDMTIAGHIHLHQAFTTENGSPFIYVSSPIARDYGEGDIYEGAKLHKENMSKHGYVLVDTESGIPEYEFYALEQDYGWHTIYLRKEIEPAELDIDGINYEFNRLKIKYFFEASSQYKQSVKSHFMSKYNFATYTEEIDSAGVLNSRQSNALKADIDKEINSVTDFSYIKGLLSQVLDDNGITGDRKEEALSILSDAYRKVAKPVQSNKVSIDFIGADNYRSLGNIRIDFDRFGITRLSAPNGTGKTNVMDILDVVLHGKNPIHTSDSATVMAAKSFFNKDTEKDEVLAYAGFTIDSDSYRMERVFARAWKYNKPKYGEDGWEEYISGVTSSVTISILKNGEWVPLDYTEAEIKNFVSENFGSYSDYLRVYKTNSANLSELAYEKPEKVIEFVLKRLGLDFLYDLNAEIKNYEKAYTTANTIINKKPVEIERDIKTAEEELSANTAKRSDLSNDMSDLDEKLAKAEQAKSEKLSSKFKVDSDAIEAGNNAERDLDKIPANLNALNERKAELEKVKGVDYSEMVISNNTSIANKSETVRQYSELRSLALKTQDNLRLENDDLTKACKRVYKSFEEAKESKIKSLNNRRLEIGDEYKALVERYKASERSNINAEITGMQSKRDSVYSTYTRNQESIEALKSEISEIDSELKKLAEEKISANYFFNNWKNAEIASAKAVLSDITEKYKSVTNQAKFNLEQEVRRHNSDLETMTETLKFTEGLVARLDTEIESLLEGVCSICGMDKKDIEAIKVTVSNKEQDKTLKIKEVENLKRGITELGAVIENLNKDIDSKAYLKTPEIEGLIKEGSNAKEELRRIEALKTNDELDKKVLDIDSTTKKLEESKKAIAEKLKGELVKIESDKKSIAEIDEGIKELKERLSKVDSEFDITEYANNPEYKSVMDRGAEIRSEIETVKAADLSQDDKDRISALKADISKNSESIKAKSVEISEFEGKLSLLKTEIKALEAENSELEAKAKEQAGIDAKIKDLESEIASLKDSRPKLQTLIENGLRNKKLIGENAEIGKAIEEIGKSIMQYKNDIAVIDSQVKSLEKSDVLLGNRIETLKGELKIIEKQKSELEMYKILKKVTDKKNLPVLVFSALADHINENIVTILGNVDFTIFFKSRVGGNNMPELHFIDHTSDKGLAIPVRECSGMQKSFAMMALKPNLIANSANSMDIIFFDEITAPLDKVHKGHAVDVLTSLAKRLKIVIVDHDLDNELFGDELRVVHLESDGREAVITDIQY